MQQKIKELRVEIDGLSKLVKSLKVPTTFTVEDFGIIKSKEIEKSYDSLILAKAWLGKVLQELGEPTPYKSDGNRHSKEDIEPTADIAGELIEVDAFNFGNFSEKNHIEKVDWLRQQIQKITDSVADLDLELPSGTRIFFINSLEYLIEARFWLGFELQRLKEE